MPELLRSRRFVAVARGIGFTLLWLLLMPSLKPGDLVFGALTVVAATALSLRIFSPAAGELHLVSLMTLMPHFVWHSIIAGFDVARRAFSPQMPINPGFVACPLALPEGLARNTFATFTSLMPGTVPCGEENGVLIYHCLDISQPIVEQLWAEEKLLSRAITAGRKHG
jgi:multicomponent Na+:H+ antiporter subunit E